MNTLCFPVGKYTLFYRLSLPEGVDYRTSTLTHDIMVPEPSFWVYGLSHSPQNTQSGQVISETDKARYPEMMEKLNVFENLKRDWEIIDEPLEGQRSL